VLGTAHEKTDAPVAEEAGDLAYLAHYESGSRFVTHLVYNWPVDDLWGLLSPGRAGPLAMADSTVITGSSA
jgi:hypothetical protein